MIRVFLTNPDQGFMDDMDDPFSSCPASHYGINHIETSKKMIINGLGAGMISKLCVSHEIKLYLLNVLSIRPIPMTRKFDYYFRRENTLYPSIDAIRDILMDLFSSNIFRKRNTVPLEEGSRALQAASSFLQKQPPRRPSIRRNTANTNRYTLLCLKKSPSALV